MYQNFLKLSVIGTLLGLFACSGIPKMPPPADPTEGALAANLVVADNTVPVVHLKDLNGQAHTLDDYRGSPYILTFWAPWCSSCLAEMPSFAKLHDQFKERGLKVVAVGIQSSEDSIARVVQKNNFPFDFLIDPKEEAIDSFSIKSVPVTFVVGKDGKVVEIRDPETGKPSTRFDGPREWASYETVRAIAGLFER